MQNVGKVVGTGALGFENLVEIAVFTPQGRWYISIKLKLGTQEQSACSLSHAKCVRDELTGWVSK